MTRPTTPLGALQLVERKPQRANTKRTEESLIEWARKDIRRSFRAGRAAYQIAKEHSCTPYLVLELDLRTLHAEVRDLRSMLFDPPPSLQRMPARRQERTAREAIGQVKRTA